jgi:hypothetical protein
MIYLIPLLIYIILIACVILVAGKLTRDKSALFRKRGKKWIIVISAILIFPIGVLYFSVVFGISLESHQDVKPGTFVWFVTMDNPVITQFPIIESAEDATFNSIGGSGPNIAKGWEIEYESKQELPTLAKNILDYIEANGFDVRAVNETQYYWSGRFKRNSSNQLFSGSNEVGEGLDLLLEKSENQDGQTRVVCSIVY